MAETFFQSLFTSIADSGRELIARNLSRSERSGADRLIELCRALLSSRGEASGAALAVAALEAYAALPAEEQSTLFYRLVIEFCSDEAAVLAAAHAYQENPTPANLSKLAAVAEPPRRELLRRLNIAPGGTAALVKMREAVLDGMKTEPALKALDDDLQHLFASWFNRGFLELKRIDWHSSAVVLEKLIAYEAVHPINGWEDLRRRLAADRRCFAFFHPALPQEPLIFVQVALVKGMPDRVQPLLDQAGAVLDPTQADTAVFFSISNCQRGLRSISFGNFLIKQVAAELSAEFGTLKTFVTLSPVPGFARWLAQAARQDADIAQIDAELGQLAPDAWQQADSVEALREPVSQLAAWYLTKERSGSLPLDPVARFHLGNGARLERIDWRGDLSPKGLRQSHGIMVNYLYRLDQVERNHEAFANERRVVASSAVEKLAKASQPAKREASKTPPPQAASRPPEKPEEARAL